MATPAGGGFLAAPQWIAMPGFAGRVVRYGFDRGAYRPTEFSVRGIACPPSLERAAVKRQAAFLAGRCAARLALQSLGLPTAPVAIGADRAPRWPEGARGSIAHHATAACCAVAPASACAGVGIDIERCMDAASAAGHAPFILDLVEQALLRRQETAFEWLLTLAFSAKESLFKALYPATRLYFDFLDARIVRLDLGRRQLELMLKRDLGGGMSSGRRFRAHFLSEDQDIVTLIWYD